MWSKVKSRLAEHDFEISAATGFPRTTVTMIAASWPKPEPKELPNTYGAENSLRHKTEA